MPAYCQRCILPDTRPGVRLDAEGVCNGCRNAHVKASLDWGARAEQFDALVERAKAAKAPYDCLIPVSGGKDSHWQVITCLERGLHPLCVTYVYPARTALGEANLRNLSALGVDHLELRVNPDVERRFVRKAFEKTAISGLVTHMGVFTFPVRLALQMGIPLVIYGENSAFEYGSEHEGLAGPVMDRAWLKRFGVTADTSASDWVDDDLRAEDLTPYLLPSQEELDASGLHVLFLGWFFPWDPVRSYELAKAHGFQERVEGAAVGHLNYVNIDDDFLSIHHHPKWHKFGITRTWDTLSMEIRMGRTTREEAIDHVRAVGDETPWADIPKFCEYIGIPQDDYFRILERFRNPNVWSRHGDRWVIPDFLIPDYEWPT